MRVTRAFDRQSHPELRSGPAQVRVSATRPVLFGLREASATVAADVEVRLQPPRLAVISTFHYVNHGGAELVVYTVSPPDAESGVRVGDHLYPGYAASGLIEGAADDIRLAFFALLHDQDLGTPIELYARDAAGNEASAAFDHRRFPREFRRSRIEVSDRFLRRVVPPIVSRTPELADEEPDGSDDDWLELYLFINGELRRLNRATLVALAAETSPHMLWEGAFRQLGNSQVESGFADHRTYTHEGEEIDQQVHLGFDLASTANAPVLAANGGVVVYADYFGIFGNCVVIDHGMGLQSLYAHLSAIGVSVGELVERDDPLGLHRPDRPRRRRPSALRHAAAGTSGVADRVVGPALDRGPRPAQNPRAVTGGRTVAHRAHDENHQQGAGDDSAAAPAQVRTASAHRCPLRGSRRWRDSPSGAATTPTFRR